MYVKHSEKFPDVFQRNLISVNMMPSEKRRDIMPIRKSKIPLVHKSFSKAIGIIFLLLSLVIYLRMLRFMITLSLCFRMGKVHQ